MTMRLLSGQSSVPTPARTDAKNSRTVKNDAPAIPPELLLRRDSKIRYERNGAVYATDGKVGSLNRVVVDESAGEVVELGVAIDGENRIVLLPPDLVDKTVGSAVFLTISRIQFAQRAASAPAFEKKHFEPADVKALLKRDGRSGGMIPRRAVANAGNDFVETPSASPLDRLQPRRADAVAAD
jgi:hemin uptake protein HemP